MSEITLVGKRLKDAGIAYNRYAEKVKDDPMCMAFLEGVQWADNNPVLSWRAVGSITYGEFMDSIPLVARCADGCDMLVSAKNSNEYILQVYTKAFWYLPLPNIN